METGIHKCESLLSFLESVSMSSPNGRSKMTPSTGLIRTIIFLFFASFLIASCSNRSSNTPQPAPQIQKSAWINTVPVAHYLGQSSYALQIVKQAREKVVNAAVSLMVAAKAGNIAEVIG